MKKIYLSVIAVIMTVVLYAQTPQTFKYQSVARNSTGKLLEEIPIAVRINILKDNSNGSSVFQETWKVTTNKFGLFNIEIGKGTPVIGSGAISDIPWGESIYFLKTEIDITGVGNTFIMMGVTQLLSVPYALYAEKSGTLTSIPGANKQLIFNDNNQPAGSSNLVYDKYNGNVAIGSAQPDASALLELNSLNRGFLPPRMSNEEMIAILNPAEGLTIYNTTVKALCYYNSSWNCLDKASLQNMNFTCNNNFTDQRNNQVYKTVQIGGQCWMKQNLNSIFYGNGDLIPNITDNIDWSNLAKGAYCNYNNDAGSSSVYGLLYNWAAATDNRNICPTGWHIPNKTEWATLNDFLGGDFLAGGKLKEADTTHWASPNTDATNESGFTALPGGGRRNYDGSFYDSGSNGYWWLATETIATYAWNVNLLYNSAMSLRNESDKNNGFSIRCLKDN